ncbi:MAG: hypothetical protein IBX60_08245, partial [Candidatus Aminicenantes bacterium]|nr:hypothetical protein [Candidatus Aminicenantes bacterium]
TVPSPSEAHCGGWEGLGKDGGGTGAVTDYTFILNCHGNRNASSKISMHHRSFEAAEGGREGMVYKI